MDARQPVENPRRIMVVGDDADERRALETILGGAGFDVACAPDDLWALRDARKRTPDAILIDFPQSDAKARDLCRQFKTDPRTSAVPLICICDRQDPEARVKGIAAGCVDSITRPYPDQEVLQRVRTYIRLFHLERQLAAQDTLDATCHNGVEIGDRLRFEQMIANLSAHFINMPPERLDTEIEGPCTCCWSFSRSIVRVAPHPAWQ